MSTPISYGPAWAHYRRLRWSFLLVWLGLPVAMILFVRSATLGAVLAVVWALGAFVCSLRWLFFRCPRCGNRFRSPFQRMSRFNTFSAFTRECRNCGLPIYSACDPELGLRK